jgi:hypothetical protein
MVTSARSKPNAVYFGLELASALVERSGQPRRDPGFRSSFQSESARALRRGRCLRAARAAATASALALPFPG